MTPDPAAWRRTRKAAKHEGGATPLRWLKVALYPAAFLLIPAILCLGLSVGAAGDDEASLAYFTYALWWGSLALTWIAVVAVSFTVWWGMNRVP